MLFYKDATCIYMTEINKRRTVREDHTKEQ